jgi:integrase
VKRRKNGQGSVTKHGDRHRARGPEQEDGTRESLGVYDTRAEALASVAAAVMLDGDKPQGLTLAAWGVKWFGGRTVDGVVKERSCWNTHVASDEIADRLVKTLTRQDILAWRKRTAAKKATRAKTFGRGETKRVELVETDEPIGWQTVKHALRILTAALEGAVDDGIISANPAAGVRVEKGAAVRHDDETPHEDGVELGWAYLTQREIDILLGSKAPEEHRIIWTVAIYTGLRPSELWGLRWCDVRLDGEEPSIFIRRSRRKRTKTRHAVRIVPLLRRPLEALKRWQALRPGIGAAIVFPAESGKDGRGGCHAEGYDAGFKTWRRKAGVKRKGLTPRSWRHTCASHLIMGTWTPRPLRLEEVRQVLGHSSIVVTQRYAHLAPGGVRAAVTDRDGHQPDTAKVTNRDD